MKKYECNYCENSQGQICQVCSADYEQQAMLAIGSNLYAAEFLLYAFHFEIEHRNTESNRTKTSPLMMLVAEG